MHQRVQIAMPANLQTVAFPANFKALSTQQSPISYTHPTSGFPIPVDVTSREQVERVGYGWRGWYTLVPNGYLPVGAVFIEYNSNAIPAGVVSTSGGFVGRDGVTGEPYRIVVNNGVIGIDDAPQAAGQSPLTGAWTLNIPTYFSNTSAITYNVSAYWYPTDLLLGTDQDQMTNDGNLSEALLALTKAMLYEADVELDESGKLANRYRTIAEQHLARAANDDARRKIAGRNLTM